MAYTDKTIYELRNTIDIYTDYALKLRDEQTINTMLKEKIRSQGLEDEYQKNKTIGSVYKPSAKDQFLTKIIKCKTGYQQLRQQLIETRADNRQRERFLKSKEKKRK